jgi:integrase/recombinase XerD
MVSERRVVASEPGVIDYALERVLAGYRGYLIFERGLSERTVALYEPRARLFLSQREEFPELGLDRLTAADVTGFLASESPQLGGASAALLVAAIRSVLRYLHVAGLVPAPLEWAVPSVAVIPARLLPRFLKPEAVAALLSSCDRRHTIGRRDFAILMLLARLGLRATEVTCITLEDVRWRTGEIVIHGKGNRVDQLPLPVDVGEALVDYLKHRPPAPEGCRSLFLHTRASGGPMLRQTINAVVRAACRRAGIAPVGCHQLRHTAATTMLQAGASLEEIGQVLRHRDRRTTAIYAHVDRAALRAIAQPWPEASK